MMDILDPRIARKKLGRKFFSFSDLFVVSEGVDSSLCQSVVEVIGEVLASVASETQEHIVLIVVGGLVGRRR